MAAHVLVVLLAGAAAASGASGADGKRMILSLKTPEPPVQASGKAVCLRRLSFDGQPPQDQREHPLQSCKEHAANTCCYPQHTELVLRRLSTVADIPHCRRVSEEVLCVLCDPRFGTGEFESKGNPVICPQLCQRWFDACQEAYVSAAPTGSGNALTFCDDRSLICSPLSATVDDAFSFCRDFGYEVFADDTDASPDASARRSTPCFDGLPMASFRAAPKRIEHSWGYGRETESDDLRRWLDRLMMRVYALLNRPEVWLLVFMLSYLIYQGVQFAKDIIKTYLMQERQQHREQILLRYGVQEEELESCDASDVDDEGSRRATLSEEAKRETTERPPNVQKDKNSE
ncbi:hypothetical protein Esti_001783 [Eimeria stiedai]